MIRRAQLHDLDALCQIETTCFDYDRLSRRSLMRSLVHPHHVLLVAEEKDNETLSGYLLSFITPHHRCMRHYSLAVLPEFRGRGTARALLEAAEPIALSAHKRAMRLELRTDNEVAKTLYEALGYCQKGVKKGFYEDGQDALVMMKEW